MTGSKKAVVLVAKRSWKGDQIQTENFYNISWHFFYLYIGYLGGMTATQVMEKQKLWKILMVTKMTRMQMPMDIVRKNSNHLLLKKIWIKDPELRLRMVASIQKILLLMIMNSSILIQTKKTWMAMRKWLNLTVKLTTQSTWN